MRTAVSNAALSPSDPPIKLPSMTNQTWAVMRRLYITMLRSPFATLFKLILIPGAILGLIYYIFTISDKASSSGPTMEYSLPVITLLLSGFQIYSFASWLVLDKQTQFKSLMLSMGLKRRSYYSGYFICLITCILPVILILAAFVVIYLFVGTHASKISIVLLFILFSILLASLTFVLSSFITSSSFIAIPFIPIVLESYLHDGVTWLMRHSKSSMHPYILFTASFSPFESVRIFTQSYLLTSNGDETTFDPVKNQVSQPTYLILAAMAFWSVLLFIFAYWFDEVCPYKSDTEVRSPFFCFRSKASKSKPSDQRALQNPSHFERRDTSHREVGIQICAVSKAFKTIPAVNNLSFDIYRGETTLLLGHNGAGKTTLMNILLGKLSPDEGYVNIKKVSAFQAAEESSQFGIGVCPQSSILDEQLSVLQHLELFADIKCSYATTIERKNQIQVTLDDVSLASESHKLPSQLSGGMKRKLSLAMSFIGKSNILILDEPSSGLDPDSRVFVWDAIRRYRGDKTVLLSTQHMEEADYLGDRIAIMSAGQVICCGSSIFLNKMFGTGYKLRVSCYVSNRKKILTFVKKFFENAKLIEDEVLNSASLCNREQSKEDMIQDMTIELGGDKSKDLEIKLIELLEDIETNSSSLKIKSCGLRSSSIEDVMLNTGKVSCDSSRDSTRLLVPSTSKGISDLVVVTPTSNSKSQDFKLFLWAQIKKHLHIYKNNLFSILIYRILAPVFFFWMLIRLMSNTVLIFIPSLTPAFVIIHYVYNPSLEKTTGFKTVQSTGGGGIFVYWLAQLIMDSASIITNVFIVNILLITSYSDLMLIPKLEIHLLISILTFMYGLAAAFFAYVLSTVISDSKSAIGRNILIYLISPFSTFILMIVAVALRSGFNWIDIPNRIFAAILPSDAFQFVIYGLVTDCYVSDEAPCTPKTEISSPLIFGFVALFMQIVVYASLLGLIETQKFDLAWYLRIGNLIGNWQKSKNNQIVNQIADQDVTNESIKAAQLINNVNKESYSLVASKLKKSYIKGVEVVKNLSFTVKKGECFGLLGVNGAGKSTTFSMLIAEAQPDSGSIWLNGFYNTDDVDKYRGTLGYDPQANLDISLSPTQALYLMARLRRVQENKIHDLVSSCLEVLEMSEHASKTSKDLSGGTKRKLALGMSLIGNPQLLALDEPTAGVDPVARRSVWQLLRSLRMQKGTSIVISSHAMEECEAICDRISIMARGQIRCIGTFLHLRSKFSQGCSIRVQFGSTTPVKAGSSVQDITSSLSRRLQSSLGTLVKLVDTNVNSATFNVSDDRVKRSKIFRVLREYREKEQPGISYVINDSSLEDIFIALAREQQQQEQQSISVAIGGTSC